GSFELAPGLRYTRTGAPATDTLTLDQPPNRDRCLRRVRLRCRRSQSFFRNDGVLMLPDHVLQFTRPQHKPRCRLSNDCFGERGDQPQPRRAILSLERSDFLSQMNQEHVEISDFSERAAQPA